MPLGASRLNFLSKVLTAPGGASITLSDTTLFDASVADNLSTDTASFPSDPSAATLVVLYYPTDYSVRRAGLLGISETNNRLRQELFINTNGTIRWYNACSTSTSDRTSTETLSNTSWNHIAISKDVGSGAISGILNGSSITFPTESVTGETFVFQGTVGNTDYGLGTWRDDLGSHAGYNIDGEIAFIGWWHTYTDFTSGTNQDKVWDSTNSRAIWGGTDGSGLGLGTPVLYHYGNTTTIATNQGSVTETLTQGSAGGDGSNGSQSYTATDES